MVTFPLLPNGFSHADLRSRLTMLLHLPSPLTAGRITYDLRRLRLHGLITRIPKTHRYRLTELGLRVALFSTRSYARLLRPGLSLVIPEQFADDAPLRRAFQQVEAVLDARCTEAGLAA